ncbi:GntR family transcriptional regulator [Pseudomonas sp. AL03]|uniref:GntR family transcriptional regulator n=1 Tax=Pseudomonas sp. AL03 TaxID=3042230 RepID=UPI00249C9A36|nr:GntR family transcriptional regulator [Pseudomonas sp. AL03]MDI3274922.1 GntR family transcriptional regulator [Pseudomonas sp. AL03]
MNSFASPQTLTALPFPRTNTGKPSADDLYSRMFDAILEQRIVPASRFTEESLGDMFGVSRSSIRQVLTRLSYQQIIILRTHHRPRVAAPDIEQTRQTLHARRLTEITLVQLASQQPQAEDLKRLHDLIARQRRCMERGERGPAIRLSGEFHLQLAEMAGNAPLAHFLGSLVPVTLLAIARHERPTPSYSEWHESTLLVQALERADVTAAVRLMTRQLDHLEQTLLMPRPETRAIEH